MGNASAAEARPAGVKGFGALAQQLRQLQPATGRDKALGELAGQGVQVFRGRALFRGRDLLEADGVAIPFRKVLLATGSAFAPIDLPGADEAGCLTPERLADPASWEEIAPCARIAVVGAGPGECHWAQVLCRLGGEVHLLARGATILPEEDPQAAALVREQLLRDGVRLHVSCEEVRVERAGKGRAVLVSRGQQREKLFVDHVLVVRSLKPDFAGLGLEAAGVACSGRGVSISDRLRTTNRRILAAGAVCGADFACPAVAQDMLRRAVRGALGQRSGPIHRLAVPRCVPTDPQIVRIGLSPQEAAQRDWEVRTYHASFAELEGACMGERPGGFAAVHVRSRSGLVAGATIVAGRAMELAGVLALLMTHKLPLAVLADAAPCRATKLDLLRLAAERCRQAQPPRFWSMPVEKAVTGWRRLRRWMGGLRNRGTERKID